MKFSRSIVLPLAGLAVIAALSGCGSNNNVVGPDPLDTTPPPAPTNLQVVFDGSGQPTLTWDASAAPDVTGYEVESLSAGGNDYVQADDPNVADTAYLLPGGVISVQVTYRVRAVDASGNWSAFSTAVTPSNNGGPEGALIWE